MDKSDKKFFWWTAGIIIFITTLPFIIIQIVQLQTNHYYTGINFIGGHDKTVYLSYIEQGRQDGWIFKNLFTSEWQIPRFFSPLWLILGKIAFLTNLSNLALFHLGRVVLGLLFFYLIYRFIDKYFFVNFQKRIVFILIATSTGIGIWPFLYYFFSGQINERLDIMLIYLKNGIDMWMPEANTYLTILNSPHFILSQILILAIFYLFLKSIKVAINIKNNLLIFFFTLFLGVFHTYDIIIVLSVTSVFLVVYSIIQKKLEWQLYLNYLYILTPMAISIIYFFYIYNQEEALKGWLRQNITDSPAFLNYIMGYGLIFIFFLIGLWPMLKKRKNYYYLFILIWSVTQLCLLYAPIQFQTKLSNGLHLPLTIGAAVGFFWLIDIIKKKKFFNNLLNNLVIKIITIQIIILLLIVGNVFITFFEIRNVFTKEFPFYLTAGQYQAALWLRNNQPAETNVLAYRETGNILPSITGKVVYLGHGHQTINWPKKLQMTEWFFKANIHDLQKIRWLKNESIDYIYFGQEEKELGNFQPEQKDYLEVVYQNQEVSIFKVK